MYWHFMQNIEICWVFYVILFRGGLVDEDDKGNMRHFQAKKMENWEEQILHHQASTTCTVVDVKRENSATSYIYGHANEDFQAAKPSWSQMIPPASSSPMSSVTSFSSNMLDFSTHIGDARHPPSDLSSEVRKLIKEREYHLQSPKLYYQN